jgi:hypothetical protein
MFLSLFALRGLRHPERVAVSEEFPVAATTPHRPTRAMDEASDAVPVGTASIAAMDEQLTIPTANEKLP